MCLCCGGAEDGIRDAKECRGFGVVYIRQARAFGVVGVLGGWEVGVRSGCGGGA